MNRFEQLAAPGIRTLMPYVPGKPPETLERELGVKNSIKLASNENPLGPGTLAKSAFTSSVAGIGLYPDGSGHALRSKLAERYGLDVRQVTLGNGSNDILVLLAEAFLTPGLEAVHARYAFAVYPGAIQACGATARVAAAHAADHPMPLGHDPESIQAAIGARTRIVFVANPNNPTGTWLTHREIDDLLRAIPPEVIVVLDEAYHEYSAALGVPDGTQWLAQHPNLVITRTFSKAHGLAGLRVGYALSHPDLADLLNRVRQPFNVSVPALAAAAAALGDLEHLEATLTLNQAGIAQLRTGLAAQGLRVPESAGNFVLVDVGRPASEVNDALLRQGVIVRPLANYGLHDHLRISTGTAAQNERLLAAMSLALAGGS